MATASAPVPSPGRTPGSPSSSSPSSSSPSSPAAPGSRTRPRSARLVRAVVLLALAAVVAVAAVAVTVLTGAGATWPVAGGLVVLALGAAATRSTHLEVLDTRREGGADRARLAGEYRGITDARVRENRVFAETMTRRLDDGERVLAEQLATIHAHEAALDRRERRLAAVEAELEQAKDRLAGTESLARAQAARAEELAARLSEAEDIAGERAVAAAARIAELETERDALRSELHLWQTAATPGRRRQA